MNIRRDRSKRYEFVLDCLPRWSVILILVFVLLIVGLFVIISLFASPTASVTITRRHASNGSTILTTSLEDNFDKVLELTTTTSSTKGNTDDSNISNDDDPLLDNSDGGNSTFNSSADSNYTTTDNTTIDSNNNTFVDNTTIDSNDTMIDNTTDIINNNTTIDNTTIDSNDTMIDNTTIDSNNTMIDNTTTDSNNTMIDNNSTINNETVIVNNTIISSNETSSNSTDPPINPDNNNGTSNGTVIVPPTFMEEIFTGQRSIIDTFEGISIYAMEFKYILKLNPVTGGSNLFGGAVKDDLKVRVHLYGRNSESEDWTMINSPDSSVSTHDLFCSQTGFLILRTGGCTPITLFHSRVIRYSNYKMNLTILNLEKVYRSGLLENSIETSFQSNNPKYSMYELGFRMTFSVLSILHWIAFLVVTFWSQQLRNWHTAQKWLVALLFLHFWYHDPLYPAMMWTGWEGFPIVSIILSVTFVYGFLFYLLIFFHSVFKAPQDRTFMNFYLTKTIIVGIGYILTLILMIWSRVYNAANPSSVDISSVPGYAYLLAANIIFLVLWGIDLAYYIFRAMGAVGKLKAKYSGRFRVIGSFSFIVAACFIGLTIAGNGFRSDVQSLTFLLLHGIVYVYFASLSFLLMPGKNEEKKPESSVSAKEMDTSNDFTKPSSISTSRQEDDDEVQISDVVLSRNNEDEEF